MPLRPPLRRAFQFKAEIYLAQRQWTDAINVVRPLGPRVPRAYALLGYALGRSGQRTEALKILRELKTSYANGRANAFAIAELYAGLGNMNQAFAWLNKSFDDYSLLSAIMGPAFDDWRADSRFALLLKRLK